MDSVSVERIMKNIYGTTATGQINMTGGNIIPNLSLNHNSAEQRPQPHVKYLDINTQNDGQISSSLMTGGKRKGKKTRTHRAGDKSKDVIIYASPEYIQDNSDLRTFIDKFFLYYRMSRSPNSAIYLIPPKNVLDEMIKKRGNFEEGSIEMQKAVRNNDKLEYDRYIFVTYGNNSKSDSYRIDNELTSQKAYPNSSFGTIRRTNIRGEVYYFTCDDSMKVKIHTNPKNASSGSTVKFVARFNNGGYIFQGDLPGASEEKIGPKAAKAQRKAFNINKLKFGEMPMNSSVMTGGSANSSLKMLERYDELYNNDHELAAEHFLRCASKAGKLSDKYRNNGDLLYSAIYFALSEPTAINNNHFGKEDTGNIYNKFKPVIRGGAFKSKVNNVVNNINNIYKKAEHTGNYKAFIESYKRIYSSNDISKMTADIASSYIRNNDTPIESETINEIFSSFENTNNSNSQMNSLIKNSFNSSPLPSAFGSEYSPVLTKMNSFETDMKNGKSYAADSKEPQYDGKEEQTTNEVNEDKNFVGEMFEAKQKNKNEDNITSKQADKTNEQQSKQNNKNNDAELLTINEIDSAASDVSEIEVDEDTFNSDISAAASDTENVADFY